jgi:RAB protein geranylgeranyltransferase component A
MKGKIEEIVLSFHSMKDLEIDQKSLFGSTNASFALSRTIRTFPPLTQQGVKDYKITS